MKAPLQTNIEFVNGIMAFSRYGALAQVFVIDALMKHSATIAVADPSICDGTLICGASWIGVAREIKAKLERQYGANAMGMST